MLIAATAASSRKTMRSIDAIVMWSNVAVQLTHGLNKTLKNREIIPVYILCLLPASAELRITKRSMAIIVCWDQWRCHLKHGSWRNMDLAPRYCISTCACAQVGCSSDLMVSCPTQQRHCHYTYFAFDFTCSGSWRSCARSFRNGLQCFD